MIVKIKSIWAYRGIMYKQVNSDYFVRTMSNLRKTWQSELGFRALFTEQ